MSTHFSTTLKQARLARGLTQRQLGELLGYGAGTAQSVISLWERGQSRGPGIDQLRKLAAALHIKIADLTGECLPEQAA